MGQGVREERAPEKVGHVVVPAHGSSHLTAKPMVAHAEWSCGGNPLESRGWVQKCRGSLGAFRTIGRSETRGRGFTSPDGERSGAFRSSPVSTTAKGRGTWQNARTRSSYRLQA